MYIWLRTFRYNCTQGQLKNKGGGELHEIKRSQDKTERGKEILWQKVNKYLLKSLEHEICFTTRKVICIMHLYWNDATTNISIEHYMESANR